MVNFHRSPSTSIESIREYSDNEYLKAEQMGREGIPCEKVFTDCKRSILDAFSGIYEPILDFIRLIK